MDALNIPVCSQKVTSNIDKNHTSYETYCLDMFDCIDALEPQTLCASATDQIGCTKIKNYKKVVDTYKQGISIVTEKKIVVILLIIRVMPVDAEMIIHKPI